MAIIITSKINQPNMYAASTPSERQIVKIIIMVKKFANTKLILLMINTKKPIPMIAPIIPKIIFNSLTYPM